MEWEEMRLGNWVLKVWFTYQQHQQLGNLLETEVLGPFSKTTKPETVEVGPELCFKQVL